MRIKQKETADRINRAYYQLLSLFLLLFTGFIGSSCTKSAKEKSNVDYNTICFYYNWYKNVETDGYLSHWTHKIAPTPGKAGSQESISGLNGDIACNFYPELGTYSSNDRATIAKHMAMLATARIGVLSLTWWGERDIDNKSVPIIMEEASKVGIKVCFHIEPFEGRSPQTTFDNIKYLIDTYGNHEAFYKINNKPVFFIYDSYLISAAEWATLLDAKGSISIRNTKYDSIFIGLFVKEGEEDYFLKSGFDGFYTYFGATDFTYGSSPKNWKYLEEWANKNNKIFIPSVGPGYIDTRIRPWNDNTTRSREDGKYYDDMYQAAINSGARYISITSFNEWHEGTQIEPAIPFKCDEFTYLDYGHLKPDYYLTRTAYWVGKFEQQEKQVKQQQ